LLECETGLVAFRVLLFDDFSITHHSLFLNPSLSSFLL
jgi:hypothetical protein